MENPSPEGDFVLTRPSWLLRAEEAVLLIAGVALYAHLHLSWLTFALLFFAPDLFMVGYLANARLGAAFYNLAHFVGLPIILAAIGYRTGHSFLLAIAILWFCHIAFDRLLGFGLKYPSEFKDTHLHHLR